MTINKIKTQRALSPTGIELADYVINPYIGCGYGCSYCYSRSNKNIKRIKETWGEFVFAKENLPELLKKELSSGKISGKVLIGSTTDPFQPLEKELRLTQTILKILKDNEIPVIILTRSPAAGEYIDLINSENNTVYFTYNPAVSGIFLKRPVEKSRSMKTIEKLYKSGINLIVYVGPVMPGITQTRDIFDDLKGKTSKIFFENYNLKMGNWAEIECLLSGKLQREYKTIFKNKKNYDNYWNNFIKETEKLNSGYNYKIEFFIYPFNSYYPQEL